VSGEAPGPGEGAGGPTDEGAPSDRTGDPAAGDPGSSSEAGSAGPDLVRAALASARAAARARGVSPGTPARRTPRRREPTRSGSGPDARDPVPFGTAIRRLVEERGWQESTSAGRVLGDWDRLVGPEIADHCRPASLDDGELVLVAESSAWATQLRLLTRTLQARLAAQVGDGVVTSIVVRGPAAPDWQRGPRRVRGRGPRDTYG
jgi:predicted nucleic acid-binding Zn ribbon protein